MAIRRSGDREIDWRAAGSAGIDCSSWLEGSDGSGGRNRRGNPGGMGEELYMLGWGRREEEPVQSGMVEWGRESRERL